MRFNTQQFFQIHSNGWWIRLGRLCVDCGKFGLKLDACFFWCQIYDGGAWFRVAKLGGISFVNGTKYPVNRTKYPQTPYSIRISKGAVRLFGWTIHLLTEVDS